MFGLEAGATAVINVDDAAGKRLAGRLKPGVRLWRTSLEGEGEIRAENVRCHDRGMSWRCESPWGTTQIEVPWLGAFNVHNVLAALAAGASMGLGLEPMAAWLAEAPGVPGRMEVVPHGGDFQVLVDYAHTDDALKNVLQSLRPFCRGRLRVMIGCGGDRDAGKRPLMASVACALADEAIFTSDNPRSEDPAEILRQMTQGLKPGCAYQVIQDREEAIAELVRTARAGDLIVLAGKGHERTQEVAGKKIAFSDRDMALKYLKVGRLA
ncbi:MAG: UDP-N-acetylmuramyl-tripeptide synthetase [Blastochloris sp.]|nr:UDP-N-acetylmuramyl-tripeptide synthetase [Blastochloris sp.]